MITPFQRAWYSLRIMLLRAPRKKIAYAKKKHIFRHLGDHCMLQIDRIPLYSRLIYIHDNVRIASGVTFLTHDVIYTLLNQKYHSSDFREELGCIEIMDHVFIGSNSTLMYGVRIGPDAVVAAGSVVTKDVPPNSVVAGVPARRIGSFDDLVEKRRLAPYPPALRPRRLTLNPELEDYLWDAFHEERQGQETEEEASAGA